MLTKKWNTVKLSKVASKIGSGITPKGGESAYLKCGVPFIRSQNILNGFFSAKQIKYISHQQHDAMKSSKIKKGDALYNITGASIGRSCLFPSYIEEANLNQHVCIVRPKKTLNSKFLVYVLNSNIGKKNLYRLQAGGGREGLNFKALGDYKIPLPSIQEQNSIIQILSTWDQAIEQTEKLIAAKEQRKKALMQQLLTGKRRFKEFEGQEWKKYSIGKLLKEVSRPVEWDDQATYNLISIRRRSGGLFKRPPQKGKNIKVKKLYTTKSGDFLISRMQVVHGAMAMTTDKFDGTHISGMYNAFVPKNPNILCMPFFDLLSRMPYMYHQAYLSSYGVHIEKMTFNLKLFLKEEIFIPASIEEQKKITMVIHCCEKEIEKLKTQLGAFQRQKQGLMQQLLTGKVRVSVEEPSA